MKREAGVYQVLGDLKYFVPHCLPPTNPTFELNPEMLALYGEVIFGLGQLNEMGKKLPDPKRFIRAYVIKEALLSSSIEGIHTTLIDVFTHVLGEVKPNKETQLVLNYTHALGISLELMQQGMPLVSRVFLAAHKALMTMGEGDKSSPGEYRKQSVRVGQLVPPPASLVPNLISDLEKYINEPSDLPVLIKAGLMHVQFETIHPFLDGNGRIGRLLIVLMLIDNGLLDVPILYPSYYFKKYHLEYYQYLDRTRIDGDFEGWIMFYLKAIKHSTADAYMRAQEIEALEKKLKNIIQTDVLFSKNQETALALLDILFTQPIIGVSEVSNRMGNAYNTAHNIIKQFITVGFLSDNSESKRNKHYRFEPYLAVLEKVYE